VATKSPTEERSMPKWAAEVFRTLLDCCENVANEPQLALRLLLCLLAVGAPARLSAQSERFQIVSADSAEFTYRELAPPEVAIDEKAGLAHFAGCPDVRSEMPWVPPGVATLRGYRVHCPERRRPTYTERREARAPRNPKSISVLFLGNSLTYYNQMPAMTQAIALREAKPLEVETVAQSGVTLGQLWSDTTALRDLWRRHWDYVVLQGGAGAAHPLFNADQFERELRRFADEVRRSGATPLLYLVWRPGVDAAGFEAASLASARRAGVRAVPAGVAWRALLESRRFTRLDWDGLHPDAFGSYLIACAVYSTIYGRPAYGAPYDLRHLAATDETSDEALRRQHLTADHARAIQEAAWRAVLELR
jgi:lysophospholipase L1-like esterase